MTNRLEQAAGLGEEVEWQLGLGSVWTCADLFHMNMEEDDLAKAIIGAGRWIARVRVYDDRTTRVPSGRPVRAGRWRGVSAT
jgi:hypothetical protein